MWTDLQSPCTVPKHYIYAVVVIYALLVILLAYLEPAQKKMLPIIGCSVLNRSAYIATLPKIAALQQVIMLVPKRLCTDLLSARMDGRMDDGWMDGWVNEWVGGWIDGSKVG